MKKAQDAFRTISEVSDVLDTPAHVLRFWESKFYQIKPVKRAGGRRYYRPDDLALLAGIRHLLQVQGLTIRGVQRMLQEHGHKHVAALGAPLLHNSMDALEGEVLSAPPPPRPVKLVPAPADPVALPPQDALDVTATNPRERLAQSLRDVPRGTLGERLARVDHLARRIDRLLERMSEASGAGRW